MARPIQANFIRNKINNFFVARLPSRRGRPFFQFSPDNLKNITLKYVYIA